MRKSGLMKKAVVLGLTVAMALGTMVTGNAAGKTWKFTFNDGTAKEAVPTGADWVVLDSLYSADKGYGLNVLPAKNAGVYVKQESAKAELAGAMVGLDVDITSDIYSGICRAAYADADGTDLILKVDLPAGTYKVKVYAGGISSNNVYDTNKIYINGDLIDQAAVNGGPKDGTKVYSVDDITYTKTITLKSATTVEIKAANPKVDNAETGKTDGGRAYFNAVVIEETAATATPDKDVPKTGVVSAAAICGVVALAGAGVAVVTRKKED